MNASTPDAKRTRRTRAQGREEILRAARQVLAEAGDAAMTVEALMRRTGMTRSAFYHYFSGVDEIIRDMLAQFEADIRRAADPWLRGEIGGDPRRVTQESLGRVFTVFAAHRDAVVALRRAPGGVESLYQQWQERLVCEYSALTAAFIRREVVAGRSIVADPERVARVLVLMNNAVAGHGVTHRDADEPHRLAAVLAGIWIRAIYDADHRPGDAPPR